MESGNKKENMMLMLLVDPRQKGTIHYHTNYIQTPQ